MTNFIFIAKLELTCSWLINRTAQKSGIITSLDLLVIATIRNSLYKETQWYKINIASDVAAAML